MLKTGSIVTKNKEDRRRKCKNVKTARAHELTKITKIATQNSLIVKVVYFEDGVYYYQLFSPEDEKQHKLPDSFTLKNGYRIYLFHSESVMKYPIAYYSKRGIPYETGEYNSYYFLKVPDPNHNRRMRKKKKKDQQNVKMS